MLNNELTKCLHMDYPIIQAPMAGGVTTSELVAAVSNNGGVGMIGAGYLTPIQLREQIREIKQQTTNNFGVNLFVPNEFVIDEEKIEKANESLKPISEQLNVIPQESANIAAPEAAFETFYEQINIVIEENVSICSFTFGLPTEEVVKNLKRHQIIVMGTATTVKEAIEVEKLGMDIVVVQGSEAGGHRGNFTSEHEESLIGLMSLVPQVVDHVRIPVVAAGGIMDGRGLMAAMCLGAKAVQLGTAFLTCTESGANPIHKEAILNASEDETVLTRAFSGKYARGIKNEFIVQTKEYEEQLPEFPVQNALTQPIRKANEPQFMSLWSGQSPRLAQNQTVKTLMNNIIAEANDIKNGIQKVLEK